MSKQKTTILLSIILIVLLISASLYFGSKSQNNLSGQNCAALVNGECVDKESYQKMMDRAQKIIQTSQSTPSASLNNHETVLDALIRQELINKYARDNKITVSDQEVKAKYESAYKSVGTESEYLQKLKDLQGIDKNDVLELIKQDLLKEKVEQRLNVPLEGWLKEQKAGAKVEILK